MRHSPPGGAHAHRNAVGLVFGFEVLFRLDANNDIVFIGVL
jgi:hypothetical protein